MAQLKILNDGQKSLKNNIRILNEEYSKRADQIKCLARVNGALLTKDDNMEDKEAERPENGSSNSESKVENRLTQPQSGKESPSNQLPRTRNELRFSMASQHHSFEPLSLAKDIIRTVESLNGHDDVGVYDFIKSVKRAKLRCSQPSLLLEYILTEKITGSAKRSIRHTHIHNYEDLYKSLETNLGTTTSIELCRAKLESIRQNNDTIQVHNQRFRSVFNELTYALQSEYSKGIERKLALQMEEKAAVKRFVTNLRKEISTQVRPLERASNRINNKKLSPSIGAINVWKHLTL